MKCRGQEGSGEGGQLSGRRQLGNSLAGGWVSLGDKGSGMLAEPEPALQP